MHTFSSIFMLLFNGGVSGWKYLGECAGWKCPRPFQTSKPLILSQLFSTGVNLAQKL